VVPEGSLPCLQQLKLDHTLNQLSPVTLLYPFYVRSNLILSHRLRLGLPNCLPFRFSDLIDVPIQLPFMLHVQPISTPITISVEVKFCSSYWDCTTNIEVTFRHSHDGSDIVNYLKALYQV
jgi:hypothetical protein